MFIHGNCMSSSLACLSLKFQTMVSYIYCTVLLHIVTTIRIFIKSPEEGRLDLTVRNIGKTNSLVVFSLLFFHYSLICITGLKFEIQKHADSHTSTDFRTRSGSWHVLAVLLKPHNGTSILLCFRTAPKYLYPTYVIKSIKYNVLTLCKNPARFSARNSHYLSFFNL